jgi:hypothetical protein
MLLHISSQLSLLDDYFIIRKYNELKHRDRAQIKIRRKKKIPVVPVSYREKIRVGRSERNFFLEYFFHGFGGFLLGDLQ